ncbi:MAG: DUF1947 domain-containing protein [Promethearchaeota archaeon]
MKVKNRHFLKSKDVKKFKMLLKHRYPSVDSLFKKHSKVEKGILEDGTVLFFVNEELTFFEKEDQIIPFLKIIIKNLISLPIVVVDTGAVPYIIKGATVMIPGIVATDEFFTIGDYVVIVDEKHSKPLAIGVALLNSSDISKEKKGKAVKNLHYIGDRYWDAFHLY